MIRTESVSLSRGLEIARSCYIIFYYIQCYNLKLSSIVYIACVCLVCLLFFVSLFTSSLWQSNKDFFVDKIYHITNESNIMEIILKIESSRFLAS